MSKRITIIIPDEEHAALLARARTEGMSMSGFLRRACRTIASGQLRFTGWDPTLITDVGAFSAISKPLAPPKPVGPALPDCTPKQYMDFVYTWRMDKELDITKSKDVDDIVSDRVKCYGCSEESLRELIKKYPPDLLSPRRKQTDEFIGVTT